MSSDRRADPDSADLRPQILLLNPANTQAGHKAFEPNIYPHLGLLTLATSLQRACERNGLDARVLYYDGSLLGDDFIRGHIACHAERIVLVGYSAYTPNYGACIQLARHAKACRAEIVNVIGNDHFSALWQQVMRHQAGVIDYGFYGNDVVEGFTELALGLLRGALRPLQFYPGLVYRDPSAEGGARRNPEQTAEFSRLPLTDYSLMDALVPHAEKYIAEQQGFYGYMRDEGLRTTIIDIARGCIKFAGKRSASGTPLNACDFCGIVPGSEAMLAQPAHRAWEIIHNAWQQGYNYLFVTADELPTTFWPLVRSMAEEMPAWYLALPVAQRPRMMCYARADAFRARMKDRIDLIMNRLRFDHFFVGLDGFSSLSLRAINKGINRVANDTDDLMRHNLVACEEIARRGGRLSAGAVMTHIGITPAMLEQNFQMMRLIMTRHAHLFMELDFELLGPIPGSLAFDYLRIPGMARVRADELGLRVDDAVLVEMHEKYRDADELDAQELTTDFVRACCPDITVDMAHDYLRRVRELAGDIGVAYDSNGIARAAAA